MVSLATEDVGPLTVLSHLWRLLAVALFAGILAGGVATIGHQVDTVPLILAAEAYEAPAVHDHGAPHPAEAWAPADGLERALYTLLADLLTGIGYALLLAAAITLRGAGTDWRQGLFWGLAGFAVFTLAPSLGLPPELPGSPVADLADRQLWWLATAALTAGGLALLIFGRRPHWAVLGVVALAVPHLLGAPPMPAEASPVPAELTHRFVVGATVVSLLFWSVLGLSAGWLHGRLEPVR